MLGRIGILASRSFIAWLLFSEADPGAAPPLGNAGSEGGAGPGAGPVGRCLLRMRTRVGLLLGTASSTQKGPSWAQSLFWGLVGQKVG